MNDNGQYSSDSVILIPNTAKKRGYKRCDRCFTRSHVKRRNCKNCNSRFPVIRPKKAEYDVCELTGVAEQMRLFSVCRTLHGLPSRGFVCFDSETSTWTCFCCPNNEIVIKEMLAQNRHDDSLLKQCDKVNSMSSSPSSKSLASEEHCAHIISCKNCDRMAIPMVIKNESIDAIAQGPHAQCLYNRIEQKINLFCPAVFRTSLKSFAVCSLPEDFPKDSNKPERHIGYLHTSFIENTQEQRKYLTSPNLRFSCQCEFYKTHSKVKLKLRKGLIRCVHYYLTLAAIYGSQEVTDYFSAFDLKTGQPISIQSYQSSNCSMMIQSMLEPADGNLESKDTQHYDLQDNVMHCPVWSFNDWLKSVGQRINESMFPTNHTSVQNLKFHTCSQFLTVLRDKLERCVKAQIQRFNTHPILHTDGVFCEYTWSFMNVKQLREIFKEVESVRFYEIVDNVFVFRKEETLDYTDLQNKLVRCMLDFKNPVNIKWIENINEINIYGDLIIICSIRSDLYS